MHRKGRWMDCLTCVHNAYKDLAECRHVLCVHPTTIAKGTRWSKGDPAWLNMMTEDRHHSSLSDEQCPTFEPKT